jgi:hypothetical protein
MARNCGFWGDFAPNARRLSKTVAIEAASVSHPQSPNGNHYNSHRRYNRHPLMLKLNKRRCVSAAPTVLGGRL